MPTIRALAFIGASLIAPLSASAVCVRTRACEGNARISNDQRDLYRIENKIIVEHWNERAGSVD